jgi:S1-C subfamily serine protease
MEIGSNFPRAFLALALLGLTGCTHVVTTAERTQSFAPFANARIRNENAQIFLFRRFGVVFSGVDLTRAVSDAANSDSMQFSVPANNHHWGLGAAAAVDRRGYFLTAAHCVDEPPVYVMHGTGTQKNAIERARVIWRGDTKKGEADLALLRVPSPLPHAFEWAETVSKGGTALAAGPDYDPKNPVDFSWGTTAGKIVSLGPKPSYPKSQLVWHKLPVHQGDSGGPLTNAAGELVAINTAVGSWDLWPIHLFIARAERPDVAWLKKLIEDDFAAHPSEAAFEAGAPTSVSPPQAQQRD